MLESDQGGKLRADDPDVGGGATCCVHYRKNSEFLGVIWDGESEEKTRDGQREKE